MTVTGTGRSTRHGSGRGRIAALVAAAAAAVVAVAIGVGGASAAGTPWSGSGTGTTAASGLATPSSPAIFTYAWNDPSHAGTSGNWAFSTVADAGETLSLHWHWTGLHAWFMVTTGIDAFVTHPGGATQTFPLYSAGPTSCCTTPSNGFDAAGDTTLTVAAGDTYGFRLRGSNGDYNSFLNGTLTVTPVGDTVQAGPVFTVNSAADSLEPDGCTVQECTLREALDAANAHPNGEVPDTIAFHIGSGPRTITVADALPFVEDAVVIDGTTQPGYADQEEFPGRPFVFVDGRELCRGECRQDGLRLLTSGSTVKALAFGNFAGNGILLESNGDESTVELSWSGWDPVRDEAAGNLGYGIAIDGSSGSLVQRNVVRANRQGGISVAEWSGEATGNRLLRNLLSDNGDGEYPGLGIDLGEDGVTPNDLTDADTGPNSLQNAPELASAVVNDESITFAAGVLHSTPSTDFTIEWFNSPSCDPSGRGEAAQLLATRTATTDATGTAELEWADEYALDLGSVVTATATGPDGTSELSACVVVTEQPKTPPTLLRVVPNGSFTTVVGRVEGGAQTADLTFVKGATCTGALLGGAQETIGIVSVPLDANGYFIVGVGNVPLLSYVAVRATSPESAPLSPCVVAKAGNDTWPTALSLDTSLGTDDVVDQPGQSRWYSFSVQPGSKVSVTLSGLPADYTLSLFKDISQAYTTLTSPADLTRLSAEYAPSVFSPSVFSPSVFSPSVFSPDAYAPSVFSPSVFSPSVFSPSVFSPSVFSPSVFSPSVFSPSVFSPSVFSPSVFSPSVFSPSVFSPSVFSPDAFASAQTRSLVAVAAEPGAADKTVTANTWSNTGRYYVRVTGRDGAFDPEGAFHVAVTRGASGCGTGVTGIGSAPAAQPGNGIKTVILTDPTRIAGTAAQKATLAGRLAILAARPEVAGAVVDLSTLPRIAALNAQADANTTCPYAKNLLAAAIKDVVDSYRANNPLQYVTIVGGDDVVPFFRYPDESLLGQESGYVPPVGSTTASEASLRLDYVLGQDAYGAKTQLSLRSSSFPVPDLAVGRLVETAAEAAGMIDAYVATGGVVAPRTSLVSGYDFLADAAGSVQADLVAGTAGPGALNDALIAPNNISPQDPAAWTAPQLKSKLLGSQRHDLVFLAGHFSANSALAADFSTSLLTTDLAAATTNLRNTIVFSAGCHSGYNIVDGHAVPGVTLTLDWAQAFAQKGATLVAGTGYQYGDTDFLEYSERIYAGLATQLRYGSGPVSLGQALVRSKQDYLATTPDIRGIHEKALLESAVFGLPMLAVNLPSGRLAAPGSTSAVTALTPAPSDPGLALGLSSTLLTVTPALVPHTVALANLGGGSLTATYYSGRDGVVTNPAEPALPLEQVDVTPPSASVVLRGVGFRGGSYTDETVVPLTGAPTTELRGVHVPFTSPVFFPMRLSTVNYYDALAGGSGGRTGLLVTPAQHRAASLAAGTSTLRRFGDVQLQLFYSGYLGSAALSAAPDISGVTATVLADPPGEIRFQARVVGDPAAGVHQVWVTYTGDGPSRWASLDLTQDAIDSSLWTGSLSGIAHPESLQFIVQAANGLGLVSLDDRLGAYHRVAAAGGPGTPAAPADTTLVLVSPPTAGIFGGTAAVTARLTSQGTPVADRTVALSIGGAGRSGTTAADGTVTVAVPLSGLPGATSVTAAFGGDDAYAAAGASAPFTLAKAPTALAPFTPQLPLVFAPGATGVSTTLTAAIGSATQPLLQQTVTFTLTGPATRTFSAITDYLGRAGLPSDGLAPGTYAVTATFAGDATYLGSTRTGQLTVTLSRQQVLDAVTAERAVASRRDRPDLRAAQRALADSLLPGTWIDELHLVVKRHGDRVFNDDIQALQQFRQLLRDRKSGVAAAKVQSWIDALTRIDQRIAELAIDEARAAGGNARKLADAAKELARGVALLGQGKLASAVQQFAEAWDDAKDSLVKPGKKSEREHDRDRGHDGDLDD